MADMFDRLVNCFAAVFPELSQEEIPSTTVASHGDWDSLASANLVAVIEEEFSLEVSPTDLDQFTSFELIHAYLHGHVATPAGVCGGESRSGVIQDAEVAGALLSREGS